MDAPATAAAALPDHIAAHWHGLAILPLAVAVESLRFAGRRMMAHAHYLSDMANCHTLTEAAEAQSSFAQETLNDYRMEAGTMMSEIRTALANGDAPAP